VLRYQGPRGMILPLITHLNSQVAVFLINHLYCMVTSSLFRFFILFMIG